jgi:hypothetical protein
MAGAVIGLLDACDTIAGGFAASLSFGHTLLAIVAMGCLGAAAGAWIGAICALPIRFLQSRRQWPGADRFAAALSLGLGLATAGLAWGFRMLLVLPPALVGGGALAAGIALAIAARRFRSSAPVAAVTWLILFGWTYWVGARLLYSFSRHGAATLLHGAWMIGLCILAMALLSTPALARATSGAKGRGTVVILVFSFALLGLARSALDTTPNALRLILYERTSFAYRLLSALPHANYEADELLQSCPPSIAQQASAPSTEESPRVRGLVMIMVDAMRGDRIPSPHTPRMTALGTQGYQFANAYTTAPSTRHGLKSMMTGMPPAKFHPSALPKQSLTEALSAADIRTIALSGHQIFRNSIGSIEQHEALRAGEARANNEGLESHTAFERARAHLDGLAQNERFFLMVHFYDAHAHYVENPMFPAGGSLEARYDAELAYADHYIGRLLDHMDASGLSEDVAVLLVGDHGEEHWEHRYRWHRARVYDESVRVPLLLRLPGVEPATVQSLVSVMDVFPTVLGLFGLPSPGNIAGLSLLDSASEHRKAREIFMSSDIYPTHAIVRDGHKVIASFHTGVMEHYDLREDPGEEHNLADKNTPIYQELRCQLGRWLAPNSPPRATASRQK